MCCGGAFCVRIVQARIRSGFILGIEVKYEFECFVCKEFNTTAFGAQAGYVAYSRNCKGENGASDKADN